MRLRHGFAALALLITLTGCTPEQIIRFTWRNDPPAAQQEAVNVAWCESRLDPSASSGPNLGLFQINWGYHGWRALPGASPYDAATNAGVAHDLWAAYGWSIWSCRPG